jgi:exopolysaccharide biosynthesis polyprenyl glycosylphosphotransferase
MSAVSTSVDEAVGVGRPTPTRQGSENKAVRVVGSAVVAVSDRSARRFSGHAGEWVCSALAAVLAAYVVGAALEVAVAVALAWLATRFTLVELGRRGARSAGGAVRLAVAFVALGGVATALGLLAPAVASTGMAVLAAAALGSAGWLGLHRSTATTRVVLVGGRAAVEMQARRMESDPRTTVVGACALDRRLPIPVQSSLRVPAVRSLTEVPELVHETGAARVLVVPGPELDDDDVRRLMWRVERMPVTVGVVGLLGDVALHRLQIETLGSTPVVTVAPSRPPAAVRAFKNGWDRVAGAGLLVLFSPVLAALWMAVRLDSRGPGFFVQTRMGLDGSPFRMYKLRTMFTDAEERKSDLAADDEGAGLLFKMRKDPRITRMGLLLRKASLDELPQLINVVRGEMSLIGPRPALPNEVAAYTSDVRRRLAVKPGMTGLWQVSGRSDLPWDESVRLDLYYADNWRPLDDLVIAAKTVRAVVQARGAY